MVVLQRPHELELVRRWTGRRPGSTCRPSTWSTTPPRPAPACSGIRSRDRRDIPIAHVTHFNRLYWDNGVAPTTVIEHGIIDPGARYTGELERGAVVVNEPGRRGRMVGADLVAGFAEVGPVDLFGMQTQAFVGQLDADAVIAHENLPTQDQMHTELARRRVYLHPMRWTSLGLSLIEAMQLAMPMVAVAATEAVEAVPAAAGVISTDPQRLRRPSARSCTSPRQHVQPVRPVARPRWNGTDWRASCPTGTSFSTGSGERSDHAPAARGGPVLERRPQPDGRKRVGGVAMTKPIVVIGDVLLDVDIVGTSLRLSQALVGRTRHCAAGPARRRCAGCAAGGTRRTPGRVDRAGCGRRGGREDPGSAQGSDRARCAALDGEYAGQDPVARQRSPDSPAGYRWGTRNDRAHPGAGRGSGRRVGWRFWFPTTGGESQPTNESGLSSLRRRLTGPWSGIRTLRVPLPFPEP